MRRALVCACSAALAAGALLAEGLCGKYEHGALQGGPPVQRGQHPLAVRHRAKEVAPWEHQSKIDHGALLENSSLICLLASLLFNRVFMHVRRLELSYLRQQISSSPSVQERACFQIADHILQQLPQRCLAHKEVVDGEHAGHRIILLRLLPLRLPQLRRCHKFRLQLGACTTPPEVG
jgi:hypothetical protein